MALGHSPISFPTGKATNSPKRKYSKGIASMPNRSDMEASACQFDSMLNMLRVVSAQTREALEAFRKSGASAITGFDRGDVAGLESLLSDVEAEVLSLRPKLTRYAEQPRKAV
jgi:predicted transcriptional regulator